MLFLFLGIYYVLPNEFIDYLWPPDHIYNAH
jgi:hypothetical protein